MSKKRILLLSSGVLVALLLAGLVGVTAISAQEPEPETPKEWHGGGRGRGGFGGRRGGGLFSGDWTMFDTAAEALGLTPEELFAELHGGKSLEEVAEAQGIEMEAVQDALGAAREEAREQAIEQAVEDGHITREQADRMLEGLEQGHGPGGNGSRRQGGCACSEDE